MAKSRPVDFINLARLAVSIAANWQLFYPNYVVNFTNLADFTALTQLFLAKTSANATQDILKKDNSANLKTLLSAVRMNAPRLKEYIRDAYSINLEATYAAYGLEKSGSNYVFPSDNDRLSQRLSILLAKLKEPNNPIALRNKGLVFWQDIVTRHNREWNLSKNMKSNKAQLSQECRNLQKEISGLLSKLFRQISLDNDKSQVASVRRTFGFLNETYK